MTWLLSDDNQRKAIKEIEQAESDRATAIVGGAFLERSLRQSIKRRLLSDKNIVGKLFKATGPLGAFEHKADLGFLLRMYSSHVHADIVRIAQIRNRFAHDIEPLEFKSREIRKLCDEIRIVDAEEYPQIPGKGLPDKYRSPPRLAVDAGAKDRFILAIKLLTIVLSSDVFKTYLTEPDTPEWEGPEGDKTIAK